MANYNNILWYEQTSHVPDAILHLLVLIFQGFKTKRFWQNHLSTQRRVKSKCSYHTGFWQIISTLSYVSDNPDDFEDFFKDADVSEEMSGEENEHPAKASIAAQEEGLSR